MKTPKAPDPKETAAAQAGMNRDTAITQQQLNMVNQVGPDGKLTYQQTGEGSFTDSQGNVVKTPTYTAFTELSPEQQAIKTQTDAAELNLGTLANEQTGFLKDYLGKPIDTSGAPALQGSIGNGYSGDIGGGFNSNFSGDIGGGYDTGFNRTIGGNFTNTYAGADDFSADRQRVVDALKARAAPDQEQQARALETQLIGRGLRPGTAAWNSEMDRLQRGRNDFALAADLAGGQEQTRLVNMARDAATFGNNASLTAANFDRTGQQATNDAAMAAAGYRTAAQQATNQSALAAAGFRNDAALTGANFGNNARAQYLQELYAARNQPLNEIGAIMSGAQVQNPQFVSTPSSQVGGVDYAGLVSDKYKADSAAAQAKMGGLFGLLGAGVSMFSDRRLKTGVRLVGRLDNGLGVYRYRYLWDLPVQEERIGVMSDEVRRIKPEAVIVAENGFDMVDYSLLQEAA